MTPFFSSLTQVTYGKDGPQRPSFSLFRKVTALVAISSALSGGVWYGCGAVVGAEPTVSASATDGSQSSSVWQPSVEEACVRAEKEDKLLLLHFWAAGSEECRTMERDFYGDANAVQQISKDYLCIPVNGTKNEELLKELGLPAIFPTDLVLTTNAEVLFSRVGLVETPLYLDELQQTAKRYHQRRQNGIYETASPLISTPDLASSEDKTTDGTAAADQAVTAGDAVPMDANEPPAVLPMDAEATETTARKPAESFDFDTVPTAPAMDGEVANIASAQTTKNGGSAEKSSAALGNEIVANSDSVANSEFAVSGEPVANDKVAVNGEASVNGDSAAVSENTLGGGAAENESLATNQADSGKLAENAANPSNGDDGIAPPDAWDTGTTKDGTSAPLMNEAFTAEEMGVLRSVPPLALDGYSPVAVAAGGVWNRGDVRYGVIHRGRTWLFTSESEVKQFLEDPDRYAPVLAGYDVVAAVDQRQLTPGLREIAAESEGQIFLFVSEGNYEKFRQDPEKYTQAAKRIVKESEMRAARAARHLGTSLFR